MSYIPKLFLESNKTYENIIVVQYGDICCDYFRFIRETIIGLGEYIARRLLDLGLKPDMIVAVGHSLGCHVIDPITAAFEKRGLGKIRLVWGKRILLLFTVN